MMEPGQNLSTLQEANRPIFSLSIGAALLRGARTDTEIFCRTISEKPPS
jgi:hypothetical protein